MYFNESVIYGKSFCHVYKLEQWHESTNLCMDYDKVEEEEKKNNTTAKATKAKTNVPKAKENKMQ